MLEGFKEQLIIKENGDEDTILTLGILINKLNEKQKLLKQDFIETFHIYSALEIQKPIRRVLSPTHSLMYFSASSRTSTGQ